MKGFNVTGGNGNYKASPVNILDKDGQVDWEKVGQMDNAVLLDDDDDRIYVVEYDGKEHLRPSSMADIEEEFEDVVVEALKRDGRFRAVEYSNDPDGDDEETDIRLIILNV